MMFDSLNNRSRNSQVHHPAFRKAFWAALIPAVILAGQIAKSDVVRVPTDDGGEWKMTIVAGVRSQAKPAPAFLAPAPSTAQPVAWPSSREIRQVAMYQADVAPAPTAEPPSPPAPPSATDASSTDSTSLSDSTGTDSAPTDPVPVETTEHGIHIVPNADALEATNTYREIYHSIPFVRTEYLANPSYRQEMAMELLTGNQRQIVVHRNYTPQLNHATERHPMFLYNRYWGGSGYGRSGGGYGGYGGWGLGFNFYPGYAPTFRYFQPIEDAY